ncbi:hypothetical protein HYY74_04335 [Candidatus Woesearchaeota archaeon]|nr:hypothetical protein [Candidatus Woesearchaeota archaeon]
MQTIADTSEATVAGLFYSRVRELSLASVKRRPMFRSAMPSTYELFQLPRRERLHR